MLLISVFVAILCAAAIASFALPRKDADNKPDGQGHLLTSLWDEYSAAVKADKPKEASAVLDKIISKAKAERLHYDFFDASTQKVNVEISMNWKVRDEYKDWLDKEIADYAEPIVTFKHTFDRSNAASLTDFVLVNKARLQAGRNPKFYSGAFDSLWTGMFKDDYEYTLWTLVQEGNSQKALPLLQDYLGGAYPKAAYLEYRQIADKRFSYTDKGKSERMAACREFISKYDGKAISLYAKALLLRGQFDSLSRKNDRVESDPEQGKSASGSLEQSYKALFEACKSAEKERRSYKNGVEERIAGNVDDFKQLMESLERKEVRASFSGNEMILTFRNLDKVSVEMSLDAKDAKPLLKKTVTNPQKSFFVLDTVRIGIPKCDDGDYVIKMKNGKITETAQWTPKTLSVAVRDDSEGKRFYVADYLTGKPLEKVDLELFRSGSSVVKVSDVPLAKDGFTPLPEAVANAIKQDAGNELVASCRDSEGFLHKSDSHYIYGRDLAVRDQDADPGAFCAVFSDKSAYNPGETISFKAVLYRGRHTGNLRVFKAGEKVKAELVNPDGKTVCGIELATNEYGSVASSFDLPAGGKNGSYRIHITSDGVDVSRSITVDEFILPTYDLGFEDVDKFYFRGDTVEVKGRVFSFSGHSLSSASVSYTVDKYDKRYFSGILSLDDDGTFTIRFATSKITDTSKGLYDYLNEYSVTVKVTDATGETRDFSRRVFVLDSFDLSAEVGNAVDGRVSLRKEDRRDASFIVSGDKVEVTFRIHATGEGNLLCPVEVEYSLKDADSWEVVSGKALSGKKIGITIPKSGLYRLETKASAKKQDGTVVTAESATVLVRVDDSDTVLEADVQNVFKLTAGCADGKVKDGEDIGVMFGAGAGPVWAVVELFGDRCQLLEHRIVHLDGKAGEARPLTCITYKYKEEYPDAVRLNIFYFRDGSSVSFSREFRRAKERPELPLCFSSFTDKALPGTEYSLTLSSKPGVEAVAAVFDKSSETIAANDWSVIRPVEIGAEEVYVSASSGSVRGEMSVIAYGSKGVRVRGLGSNRRMAKASVRLEEPIPFMLNDSVLEESAVESAPMAYKSMASNDAGEELDISGVAVRSDFSSTLAFEPFLRSDGDGKIFLKFRTSDKLSTFVAQVWAHTPEMHNAAVHREFIVTVPVKVSVVEPKYLYKGDKFTLHATVSNNSEADVTGEVSLRVYSSKDYEGAKPFYIWKKSVTVPAGGSVPVEFDVDPKNADELGMKVVFADKAGAFSDGVFVSLPVNEAKQVLTESHSAVLFDGAEKSALVRRLESEFTGTTAKGAEVKEIGIRQMILDAVPSKVEPKGKDVLSLSEALYVREVARRLGSDVETETSDESLVERIVACRNADGGFGWFEGFRSSPIVTAVLLERFAKMRDAGLDFGGIELDGAVKWLDRNQFLRSGNIPRWCDWLSMEQYAFVRSMYPSVAFDVTPETKIDKSEYSANFKEFKKSLKDYLLPSAKDGRGLDGQILAKARRIKTLANLEGCEDGLALAKAWGLGLSASSKMNQSIIADIQSLLEYVVEHPDGGCYYPNAVMPWRGLLESEAYAHSLLCDLLTASDASTGSATTSAGSADASTSSATASAGLATAGQTADGIRLWLMLQKETQKWDDDPAFVDALNSVLSGSDRLLRTKVVSLTKTYSSPFSKIAAAGNGFSVERHFYKEVTGENGKVGRLEIFPGMKLNVGDKVTAEYRIWNQENRSFVRLTAPREAAFRPVEQLSGPYGWRLSPLSVGGFLSVTPQGYRNVATDRTEYWFDLYPEDKSTVSEEFYITQEGTFTAPVVTIESLYAPHYRANSAFSGVLRTF